MTDEQTPPEGEPRIVEAAASLSGGGHLGPARVQGKEVEGQMAKSIEFLLARGIPMTEETAPLYRDMQMRARDSILREGVELNFEDTLQQIAPELATKKE